MASLTDQLPLKYRESVCGLVSSADMKSVEDVTATKGWVGVCDEWQR